MKRGQIGPHSYHPSSSDALYLAIHSILLSATGGRVSGWTACSFSTHASTDSMSRLPYRLYLGASSAAHYWAFPSLQLSCCPFQHHYPPVHLGRQPTLCFLRLQDVPTISSTEISRDSDILRLCMVHDPSACLTNEDRLTSGGASTEREYSNRPLQRHQRHGRSPTLPDKLCYHMASHDCSISGHCASCRAPLFHPSVDHLAALCAVWSNHELEKRARYQTDSGDCLAARY